MLFGVIRDQNRRSIQSAITWHSIYSFTLQSTVFLKFKFSDVTRQKRPGPFSFLGCDPGVGILEPGLTQIFPSVGKKTIDPTRKKCWDPGHRFTGNFFKGRRNRRRDEGKVL